MDANNSYKNCKSTKIANIILFIYLFINSSSLPCKWLITLDKERNGLQELHLENYIRRRYE